MPTISPYTITCPYCHTNGAYKTGQDVYGRNRYKCRGCGRKFTPGARLRAEPGIPPEVTLCVHCGNETTNPKFCSRSCSTAYNNHINPRKKRTKQWVCKYCGEPTKPRNETCRACNQNIVDWRLRTLGEVQNLPKYQVNARLRSLARRHYMNSTLARVCRNCGYNKHIEICHIRSIGSFPDDTPIPVVNDLSNLVALCPNCHWEFDHGLLTV